jgi:hypothetical protein
VKDVIDGVRPKRGARSFDRITQGGYDVGLCLQASRVRNTCRGSVRIGGLNGLDAKSLKEAVGEPFHCLCFRSYAGSAVKS